MPADSITHIADIREGDRVSGSFLLEQKARAMSRTGKPFLTWRLRDKTGLIEGRVWDNADVLDGACAEGQVVRVVGRAAAYRGTLQLSIEEAEPAPSEAVVLEDYLPTSRFSAERMQAALRAEIDALDDADVRALLHAVLALPPVAERFAVHPAATTHHHAFLGGLLEHTLSVLRVCDGLVRHYARLYPGLVDRSLLVAGAILHDVGKTIELDVGTSLSYADEGRLIGHLVQGAELVTQAAATLPDFPRDKLARVKHLILAHHGQLEFGSPKRPHLVEALLLHHADMIDSRLQMLVSAVRQAGSARWTPYQSAFEAYLFNPLAGAPPLDPEAEWWADEPPAVPDDTPAGRTGAARGRGRKGTAGPGDEVERPRNLDLFS